MKRISLGKKLIFGGLVLLVLPLAGLGAFSVYWSSSSMQNMAGEQLESMRDLVLEQVNSTLKEQADLLRNAAARDGLIQETLRSIGESGIYDLADFKLNTNTTIFHDKKTYEFFLMTDTAGVVVGDTLQGAFKGKDLSGEDYIKKALQKQTAIGDVRISERTHEAYIVMASPLVYKDKFIGVGAAGWRIQLLNEKMNRVRIGRDGKVMIADRAGNLIVHPDKEKVLKAKIDQIKGMERVAREAMSGQAGSLQVSSDDGALMASYAPVPEVQWSLALVQPEAEIQAPIVHMRNLLAVAVLGLSVLVAAFITWAIHREINRPIQRIVEQLGKGASEVATAASQLSNASKSLADQSTEQAASLEETTSSLEEMASMTKQNADHAAEADKLMQEANQSVDDAGNCIKSLNASMTEVSESSSEISRIIKTIDEIAFQTNLLALNAAVEAARAGQAGAGFAVVADEVRALAIKAADAARNTATLIEETITKISHGTGDLKKTVDKFKDVASKTDKVGQLLREITAASNEQAQGIEQINKAASEMDKTVQQNAASAEQSASASTELNLQSDAVRTVVQELESMVGLSRGLESEETASASIRTGKPRNRAKHEAAEESALEA